MSAEVRLISTTSSTRMPTLRAAARVASGDGDSQRQEGHRRSAFKKEESGSRSSGGSIRVRPTPRSSGTGPSERRGPAPAPAPAPALALGGRCLRELM